MTAWNTLDANRNIRQFRETVRVQLARIGRIDLANSGMRAVKNCLCPSSGFRSDSPASCLSMHCRGSDLRTTGGFNRFVTVDWVVMRNHRCIRQRTRRPFALVRSGHCVTSLNSTCEIARHRRPCTNTRLTSARHLSAA